MRESRGRPVLGGLPVLIASAVAAAAYLSARNSSPGGDDQSPDAVADSATTRSADAAPDDSAPALDASHGPIDRSNEDELMRAWMEAKAQCHTDQGFPATLQPDGGIETPVAPGQEDDYLAVSELCDELVTAERGPAPVDVLFTEDELSVMYDLLLEQGECLAEAGYPVTEPTSRERYIEETLALYARADDVVPWSPAADVPPSSGPDALQECPAPTGQDVAERQAQGAD